MSDLTSFRFSSESITATGIKIAHIDPGKPWQNVNNESFNDKFRDEC